MANSPRKPKDPTELALSAIEHELNVMREPSPSTPAVPPRETTPAASRDTTPSERLAASRRSPAVDTRRERAAAAAAPRVEPTEPLARTAFPDDGISERLPAANENRENVGNLLRALQRR